MSLPSTPGVGTPIGYGPTGGPSTPSGASTPGSSTAATGGAGASLDQVVRALQVLYHEPDKTEKERANAWLGEFQKSNDAWATAQLILFAPDAPVEPKLFAAQTFRQKITYDLEQLPPSQLLPLRDSLLTALRSFADGPRIIRTQVCLALAALALQLTPEQWPDPIGFMIDLFGKDPALAGALLEFLQVIAEEYNSNMRIEVRNDFGSSRGKAVERGEQVVGLLSMYVQATGITSALHNQCFECLGAWLRTGQAAASSAAGSAVLASAFASLQNDELFDSAVDLLVDTIHETQELDDNVAVIQEIVGRLLPLKDVVMDVAVREDEDKMRGYCRILVEAGEWYDLLILQHQDSFLPLVQAIAACASHENLEIVGITLNFWYRLAKGFRSGREKYQPTPSVLDVFSQLVSTIIRHLHYPGDDTPLAGQERDDFREFRHKIGDTLKDCCSVLGATTCLRRSLEIITTTLAAGASARWQDIEAPLFSMRSMGAEVDPQDNEVMPQIMDILPKLPSHPKIRYASTLVIGRYTQWIDYHPDNIQFTLPYIIAGFEDGAKDTEVSAAAAQAMKYLCKDCSRHLVGYLPQLHSFLQTVSPKLPSEDLLELSAAVAHIICDMPLNERAQALGPFVMPNVEVVHALVNSVGAPTSKQQMRVAIDALERIDMMLAIVEEPILEFPPECANTCQQSWLVFDQLLAKFGSDAVVAEKACVAIRRGMQFFGELAGPVAPKILDRMALSFDRAPASSYLWITSKIVERYQRSGNPAFVEAAKSAVERECNRVFALLQTTPPTQIPDILDDFVNLFNTLVEYAPEAVLLSSSFPAAYQATLAALTLLPPQILLGALDAVRAVIGHESLQYDPSDPHLSPQLAQAYPQFATSIRSVVSEPGAARELVRLLLDALVDGHDDLTSNVLTMFRLLGIQFAPQLVANVPLALDALDARVVGHDDKVAFAQKFQAAMEAQNPNQVKDAFTWLMRTSRRNRERTRIADDRR